MLGSVSEAEDIVQEAFLRLHRTIEGGERIESPAPTCSTVVTRLVHRPPASALPGEDSTSPPARSAGPPGRRRRRRPRQARRDGRLAVAGVPRAAGACRRAAGGVPAARGVRLPTTRSPRSWRPARSTPASPWLNGGTSSFGGRGLSRHLSDGSAWPDGSSPPPGTATSTLEELLAHDVTLHGGGLPSRSRAGCGSPATCWRGCGLP